jgi:type I restriction enzyme, S subunit
MADNTDINGEYKTTELGILPEEWKITQLKELGILTDGDWILNKDYSESGVRLIQVGDIGIGKFIGKSSRFIKYERAFELKCTFLQNDDILISRMADPIGRSCIFPKVDYPAITAVDIAIFRINQKIVNLDFVNFALNSPQSLSQANKMAGGVTRQRASRKNLERIILPLPPLPEQHAIAHVLHIVKETKEKTDAVIAATKALKAAMMMHLFMYGPVPPEEAEKIVLRETEIGQVPEEWGVARFSEVVDIAKGQIDPTKEPYKKLLHIGPENIVPGTGQVVGMKTSEDIGLISGQFYFTSEQVIYSKIRPYLKKAAFPKIEGTCSADMYPLKPKDDRLSSEFLFQYLLSDQFSNDAISFQDRTGIPKINRQQLGLVNLPLPPLTIQQQIATILTNIDQKLSAEQSREQALDTLFATILHDLMTAKIRVNEIAV